MCFKGRPVVRTGLVGLLVVLCAGGFWCFWVTLWVGRQREILELTVVRCGLWVTVSVLFCEFVVLLGRPVGRSWPSVHTSVLNCS